jgi:hypothetical protein
MREGQAVRAHWVSRIETLGTTAVVLMVGSMMLWYEAIERGRRLAFTIGSAVVFYIVALVLLGLRSGPARIAWWPFAVAGLSTGVVAGMINARFLVTRELFVAAATGLVIGTAHWAALRVWVRLTARRAVP